MKSLDIIALTLIIIGAINWALVGIFQYDVVAAIFGGMGSIISRGIYLVIGICGLYALSLYSRIDFDRDAEHSAS